MGALLPRAPVIEVIEPRARIDSSNMSAGQNRPGARACRAELGSVSWKRILRGGSMRSLAVVSLALLSLFASAGCRDFVCPDCAQPDSLYSFPLIPEQVLHNLQRAYRNRDLNEVNRL